MLPAGDVKLSRHVDEVVPDQTGVSRQSLLDDAQGRRKVIAFIVTPEADGKRSG